MWERSMCSGQLDSRVYFQLRRQSANTHQERGKGGRNTLNSLIFFPLFLFVCFFPGALHWLNPTGNKRGRESFDIHSQRVNLLRTVESSSGEAKRKCFAYSVRRSQMFKLQVIDSQVIVYSVIYYCQYGLNLEILVLHSFESQLVHIQWYQNNLRKLKSNIFQNNMNYNFRQSYYPWLQWNILDSIWMRVKDNSYYF